MGFIGPKTSGNPSHRVMIILIVVIR